MSDISRCVRKTLRSKQKKKNAPPSISSSEDVASVVEETPELRRLNFLRDLECLFKKALEAGKYTAALKAKELLGRG